MKRLALLLIVIACALPVLAADTPRADETEEERIARAHRLLDEMKEQQAAKAELMDNIIWLSEPDQSAPLEAEAARWRARALELQRENARLRQQLATAYAQLGQARRINYHLTMEKGRTEKDDEPRAQVSAQPQLDLYYQMRHQQSMRSQAESDRRMSQMFRDSSREAHQMDVEWSLRGIEQGLRDLQR